MCTGPPPQSTSQDTPSPQRPYQVCFTDEETEAQKPNRDQEEEKAGMRLPGSPAPRSGLSAGLSTELAFAWAQLPVQMGELGQMGV